MKVYGPYKRASDGRAFIVEHEGGRKGIYKTKLLAKHIMEQKLGRELLPDEEVDHIDGNLLNDSEDNLQVLSKDEHKGRHKHLNARTPTHGTLTEATHYKCKCELCMEAKRVYQRNYIRAYREKYGR